MSCPSSPPSPSKSNLWEDIYVSVSSSSSYFFGWQVVTNQEAIDIARKIKDPRKAAEQLTAEALKRDSKDDISCVVVKFKT